MVNDAEAKKIIAIVAAKVRDDYQPEKIILYGSFAYGKPGKDSDIDLLIVKETQARPIDRRVMVRRMVSGLRKGYPFSSIVVTPRELSARIDMGDQFFGEILSKGEVLYAKQRISLS